jgi:Golgi phosphoprotein 3
MVIIILYACLSVFNVILGETWNFSKLNYQLKQVRERIAKGLVEKGILRNDMKSYFLFEVSAYPMRDTQPKKDLVKKLSTLLTQTPEKCLLALNHETPNQTPYLRLRVLLLAICATCAEVLDNIFDDYWADQAINTGENLLDQMSIYPLPKQCTKWLGINQAVHMHYAPQLEMISTVLSILKSS